MSSASASAASESDSQDSVSPCPSPSPAYCLSSADLDRWRSDTRDFDSTEWDLVVSDPPKYHLWKRKDPSSDIYTVRAVVHFPSVTLSTVFGSLYDLSHRRAWDQSFLEMSVKHSFSPVDDLLYSAISAPFPMTNRDSLQRRSYRMADNEFTYVYQHVEHHSVPERKGFIRTANIGCFHAEIDQVPDNGNVAASVNGVKLCLVMRSDPKGAIPTMIINKIAPMMARKWIERLLNYCVNREKELEKEKEKEKEKDQEKEAKID